MCRCAKLIDPFWSAFVIVCSLNVIIVKSFNIDVVNYTVHEGPRDSMFGFTVAVHKDSWRSWVLVGAPEAQSDHQYQYSVFRGGVVFKCEPQRDEGCQEIPFDTTGNHRVNGKELDRKSNQWFGATLSASENENGGPVVACAPRYVWFSKEMNRKDPVGTCFVSSSDFNSIAEYSPCRTSNWGYHRQGSCQAGFSAAIDSEGESLFVGAPGSYYWQGQTFSVDAHANFSYTPPVYGMTFGAKGSVHQQSLANRPAVFQTREGRKEDDDSYLGYATIVGDFQGNGKQGIAVGMPRGAELHGKVLLFTWDLTNYKNISGSQLGSYFGYALAAADLDGDSKIDLVVGAPMHTESNTEGKYDVGRVYVFYQKGEYGSYNKSSFLDGVNSRSRFGQSLACLGDLNQDGYEDFAVGAPYDGPFNRGAVYIFYGSAEGVLQKYGQVIYAEDIRTLDGGHPLTFGFSVTGGRDLDENDYPDMVVGAYLSNVAFSFRSRPVVRVNASVTFLAHNNLIDIKEKNCTLPNGQRGACTSVRFCVQYRGKGIPNQLDFKMEYILDTKKPDLPRMLFMRGHSHRFSEPTTLYNGDREFCKTEVVYVKNDIRDKLTAIEAEMKYLLVQNEGSADSQYRLRDPRSQLLPTLDLNSPPIRKDSISIQKNCGFDNICVPNLHINVTKNVEKYLLDSNTNLEFDVVVSNFGEDAFETTFDVKYPEEVYYTKTERALCSPHKNDTLVTCDIGNPLAANRIAKFKMIFEPKRYHKQGMSPTYYFEFLVNSTNPEDNSTLKDNHIVVPIDIWVDSSLEVNGGSTPRKVHFLNVTSYTSKEIVKESDIGPQVTHVYTLKNKGPAVIQEAEMYFLWPWQTLGGEDLLYLLDQPHVNLPLPKDVTVKCDIPAPANYKGYQLDPYTKYKWDRLRDDSFGKYGPGEPTTVRVESVANVTAIEGGAVEHQETKLNEKVNANPGDASSVLESRHGYNASTLDGHHVIAGMTENTKSEWVMVTVNGKPVKKFKNVTTIQDATGKIIKTLYEERLEDGTEYKKSSHPPQIVYSSTGNTDSKQSVSDFSISGRVNVDNQETKHHVATVEESSQTPKTGGQESRHYEEHAYSVGGGPREGGSKSTIIEEEHIIRTGGPNRIGYEDEQKFHAATSNRDGEQAHRRTGYDQGRRVSLEDSQKSWQQRGRNEEEETRLREEARFREEARLKEEVRLREEARIKEEVRLREERIRQEEERRRLQNSQHGGRSRTEEEQRRWYEEQQRTQTGSQYRGRNEEDGRRQHAERQRQEEERRKQEEEKRRYEEQRRQQEESMRKYNEERKKWEEERRIEERRRTETHQQWLRQQEEEKRRRQQTGSEGRYGSHGRQETGYFDAQGKYHDTSDGRGTVVVNKTYTIETEIDQPIDIPGGVYHSGIGQSLGGDTFRTQTLDLGSFSPSSTGTKQEWHSSSTYGRQNRESGQWKDVRNHLESRHRTKRQTIDPEMDEVLKCRTTNCFYARCIVSNLEKGKEISVSLRSRVNARVVRELSNSQSVKLSSMMVARISKLPHIGVPKEQVLHSHEVFTEIPAREQEEAPKIVPLWIVLLSAIAGTLILLLVILLLYKCGFFRRNRPSSTPERQPLNRNGYQHGDEAL